MLSRSQRVAILELHTQGISRRQIAKTLKVSRSTVKKVIRSGSCQLPEARREIKAAAHRQQILELFASCKGNKVRVHEELEASGVRISYPALTAFCRQEGIDSKPKVPTGHYDFAPGREQQHDTSPFRASIAGRIVPVQIASTVLCFSRMLFFQNYPRFQRFECKLFLTECFRYYDGSCAETMIDNTHVIVLRGTGAQMVPVPEMVAFGERYGFVFKAHEVGDANRSARVEGPFWFIQNNFFAGRSFCDWDDLNAQARAWCDRVNASHKRSLRAAPRELFAMEKPHLRPLPIWVPEVYRLHHRVVDDYGYVNLHTNRYSVPVDWISRRVEVQETKDRLEIFLDKRTSLSHRRLLEPLGRKITLAQHRPRRSGKKRKGPSADETAILAALPEMASYLTVFKAKSHKQITLALRQLRRLVREYPRKPLLEAVREAERYGLFDLDRLERMVLRRVGDEYFLLEGDDDE